MVTKAPRDPGDASPPRLFTIKEAQNLIPEIEPLVAEMKSLFARIRTEVADAASATGIPAGSPRLASHLETRGVAPALIGRVNELVRMVHERGCVVNGPEAGLVDFPALLGSEIVFLCWKHGENLIEHWHRIPDGYAGRKPLLDLEGAEGGLTGVH